jgi:hypothetical protein
MGFGVGVQKVRKFIIDWEGNTDYEEILNNEACVILRDVFETSKSGVSTVTV